jgi:hypothetical protein
MIRVLAKKLASGAECGLEIRDAQENKVPIAIFPIGALLRECTLR